MWSVLGTVQPFLVGFSKAAHLPRAQSVYHWLTHKLQHQQETCQQQQQQQQQKQLQQQQQQQQKQQQQQ